MPGSDAVWPAHYHPVLCRVLAARGVVPAQAEPVLAGLAPVGRLPGVAAAARRLVQAQATGERVVVLGDFDADGATATALVVHCLRRFGFCRTAFVVPNRFEFGYGLSPEIAAVLARDGPGLLVSVDNGIASVEGVARAVAGGLDVLVTDHHLPGSVLPTPALIVNPALPDAPPAYRHLSGVGVAFYVMAALARALAEGGLVSMADGQRIVAGCLDLVALGTVADMVPLDFNNRVLVAEGLRRIRAGQCRPGVAALCEVAGRDHAQLRAADLGFALAPRLNAAGRLDDMTRGIDCLLSPEKSAARPLAARLDALNRERRELQARMQAEAEALVAGIDGEDAGAALCLHDERWHQGIVGLVAARLCERSGKPAVAFAPGNVPGMLRGSARSTAAVHVRDAIALAATLEPGMTIRFGGHAMAAGLSLAVDDYPRFRRAFGEAVSRCGDPRQDDDTLWTDGHLAPDEMTLELAAQLAASGPWGQAFPEPLFENHLRLAGQRVIGERHLRLRLVHPGGEGACEAVAFDRAPLAAAVGAMLRVVYRLDVNHWGGRRTLQLVVEHIDCD